MTCQSEGCDGEVTDRLNAPDGIDRRYCADCASELLTFEGWSYVEVIR